MGLLQPVIHMVQNHHAGEQETRWNKSNYQMMRTLCLSCPSVSLGACLHEGKGPQMGEVTCGGSPNLSCKHACDQIKMRDYNWTGVLPHLSGSPHLPRVPHLHVNRPLV